MYRLLTAIFAGCLLAATTAYADTASPTLPNNVDPGVAAATQAGAQNSDSILLSVGGSGWTGHFGAPTTTDIEAALFGLRYKIGDLRLTASVPLMRIDSAGAIFTGIDGTPLLVSPRAGVKKTVRQGLGDLTLGGSYLLKTAPSLGVDVEIIGRVKLPTASSSSGLSTGRTDYSVGTEFSKPIGRFVTFASVSYRGFGDNAVWKLKDGVATSVGANYFISDHMVGGLSYDFAQKSSQYISDSHEIVASLSSKIPNTRLRLTGFAASGLSRGAAAFSGGLSLAVGF